MQHPYLPILLVLLLGILFSALFLGLSAIIGPKKKSKTPGKFTPYECGLNPIGDARAPIDVKFSLVAMVFILFDIETVFLYPWAILYRKMIAEGQGLAMFVEMSVFMVVLSLGLLYIWKKGALDWNVRRRAHGR
ncbi:MAG TPA: NADH-quinone oxidoreductase subunit A [Deltaproteobacteria bacterium]|nr:MAG: hypothetical protein A2048_08525 [Deltaproteobacteria bacterium GWA2_45_12]HBF12444.1 NADH-quinone oxidoreductase subunit A [Deltaproteobacteria bacterium]